ncbi:MAG: methylated-DNA--[protein]-cysteine S-methyltransferase [Candidatus Thorarchaeota archaeon]
MVDKRVAILRRGGFYVAGVFTLNGIFSCNLPEKSRAAAISSVSAQGLVEERRSEDLQILGYIFDIIGGIRIDPNLVRFDFSGFTDKQIRVLKSTLKIPFGETRTYEGIANDAGLEGAYRFVGNVMASNRFPPLIPCHRVVAKNGIGGYGAGDGIPTKVALLKAERAFAD